jgi:N-acetylglucosaminyldiphosphoundecaprenol N-acetyl-beta-D-mannosaminyltransferase
METTLTQMASMENPVTGRRAPHAEISDLETVEVIGVKVAVLDYARAVQVILEWAEKGDRAYGVAAANTHVAALARHDRAYGAALGRFDLICPDGMPLRWSVNHSMPESQRLRDRVYGPTLMLKTLEGSDGLDHIRHFLLGGEERTLEKLGERMQEEFSGPQLAGSYSPPFGEWPEDEFERICGKITESGANVVWVGLGCPKQELWIGNNLHRLPPAVYLGVGAAFAFHAGEVRQAPAIVQRAGMEWCYRLVMEPRRLWRRYLVHNSLFIRYWVHDTLAEDWDLDTEPAPAVKQVEELATPPRCNVLGVGISVLDLDRAGRLVEQGSDDPGVAGYVTVTGVHGVMESRRDPELQKIHNQSFLSTPDGMPMVWIGNWTGHEAMDRVYGPDLMLDVVSRTAGTDRGHYFFGGAEGVAEMLAGRLKAWFPGTEVVGTHCPPFRDLTMAEEETLVAELREKRPHFFWVGLGTPKQERFMHGFLKRHPDLTKGWNHGLILLGVGAAFDFHAGRVQQAPYWMQRKGLEWFFRLCVEPLRLWKRYSINNSGFIVSITLQLLNLKKYPLRK